MTAQPDPLWDPAVRGDPALERLQSLLGAYRHVPAPGFPQARSRPAPPRWRRRALPAAAAALAACVLGFAVWLPWRLQWAEGMHWRIEAGTVAGADALEVGRTLATAAHETATVQVARIGSMQVLPGTRIRLADTRAGHHRLDLLEGRVRARIWAPPGHFGISAGASEAVDLGCEFELERDRDGAGSLAVTSGWVMHTVHGQETLVPAGSSLRFDEARSGIPLAGTATPDFRAAVERLDLAMAQGRRAPEAEVAVAAGATAADGFALLTLLTRYPALASGPLYPEAAALYGAPGEDPGHRQAWLAGDVQAMNAWWEQVPRPPKAWWLNWRDALG
jgi:hypothetical protein